MSQHSASSDACARARCRLAAAMVAFVAALVTVPLAEAGEFSELARFTMRLRYLQKTWHRDVLEHDPVQTQVMDAQVSGQQTTSVAIRLSSEPGRQMARLYLHGTGHVQSSTIGLTREARVDSLGSHSFQLTKPVYFDGTRFLTSRCYGHITATTQPVAVQTVVSGVPLLGSLGDRIAWSETLRRQPTTNSIVVRQVADDVVPEFNCRVDEELATANRSWTELRQKFARLLPGRDVGWQAESTSDGLSLRVGLQNAPGSYSTFRPLHHTALHPEPETYEDLVVTLSDGMINELLHTVPLKGLTVTDTMLEKLQTADFSNLFRDGSLEIPSELREAATSPASRFSLQFADETPLEVQFEQGGVAVVLRFRVLMTAGDVSELHRLTLHVRGDSAEDGDWSLRISDVDVTTEDPLAPQDSITDIIRDQSRSMFTGQPPTLLPRLTRLQESTGLPDLLLLNIRSRDGELRASFQLADDGNSLQTVAK